MESECLFQTFLQTSCRAGIQSFQIIGDMIQRGFGVLVTGHRIGRLQPTLDVGLVSFRQMLDHVAPFMDLTALNLRAWKLLTDPARQDRKSTRLNSSHRTISYAVF